MEFPTIDEIAKEVTERALDKVTYEGKTIIEDLCYLREKIRKCKE